ncbi:MAG: biotin/lipoyl-binding protein, partial [Alphaproteobacteria bacterium]
MVGLCLALCGCGLRETSSADDATYLTSVAEIGDVRDVVPATGILLADGAAEIRASEPGVIEAVFVKEGDRVTAGQILARLVAPGLLPVRDEALAATAAAAADVRQAELALKAAEQDRDRRAALMARGF